MKNINFFVYGSLREGFYNYNKFLAGKIFKKKQGKLHNVKLYHMPYKGYPAIVPGEDYVLGEIMVINKAVSYTHLLLNKLMQLKLLIHHL